MSMNLEEAWGFLWSQLESHLLNQGGVSLLGKAPKPKHWTLYQGGMKEHT